MKMSENINEVAAALSKVQGALKPAKFDGNNPYFKSKYTTLAGVWDSIRNLIAENNLAVVQDVITDQNGVGVETTILHSSGQFMTFGPLHIALAKKEAHAVGSATSYGKRYALAACLGVCSAEEDDDGNRANDAAPKEAPPPKAPELTLQEYSSWVNGLAFDSVDIENYLRARSAHFKESFYAAAYDEKKNPALFESNMKKWLAKQEK